MASTQIPAPQPPSTQTGGHPAASDRPSGGGGAPVAQGPLGQGAVEEERATRRLLLFSAGSRVYGCDIVTIREIVPFRRCTRLPGAPAHVCGLINLRGTLVTVVDLAVRLDGATSTWPTSREAGSVVLVEYGSKVVGLAVDQVRDVQAVAEENLEPVSLAAGDGRDAARGGVAVFHGSGQLDGEVVVVLDVHTILKQVLA